MQAINVKNLYGIETRDNKGSELTWKEMDDNFKILSLASFLDVSGEHLKQISQLLLAVQDTDFNLYSNVLIVEQTSLISKVEDEVSNAFLELDNLNYNESVYIVIPFTYYEVGEGLDGVLINIPYRDDSGDKQIEWTLVDKQLKELSYEMYSQNGYQSYDLYYSTTGDQMFLIGEVYWD